ncbi:hypothetical protein N7468_009569 [Penicillium chermesinum]|uniref:Rhodopsin domain-containing protein n=1 Tax=Penicillium chermesinum TaxID=63820 RepID=A0A9W9NI16_9EURO|nr:uncharacterized protein N7468_009569 [Penicillium chermesinum]KAJ5220365.1 hypothetical protein N7468_009569 [Penicillium chermesinum]KAJ6157806.1 hypothetical protein N7470_005398 [Penicillium chermesinum]
MSVNVEAWVLLSLALAFIIVRIIVRWNLVGISQFQLDDYLMPVAGAVFTAEVVAAYLVVADYSGLTNSYMSTEERASLDPSSHEFSMRVAGSKIQVIGWSLYVASLWLIKFCLAIFYSRLTTGLQNLPTRVRGAYILLGVTWLAAQLSLLLSCQPFHRFWQVNPDPGNICQPTKSPVYVYVCVIFDIITDLYLLLIPLPLLWAVKINIKRKIPLIALFSGATFVMVATLIRAVVIVSAGPDGAVSGSKWACREGFVSIIVSNLPIIQPLIRKLFSKIGLSQLFSSSGKPNTQSYPLSSRGFQTITSKSGTDTKKGKSNAGAVTGTLISAWGSDEHILNDSPPTSKDITVVSETVVQSEPWDANKHSPPPRREWDSEL